MKVPDPRSTAQEIDTWRSKVARAGCSEQKANSLGFDEAMHFVEQVRSFLDFFDDHDFSIGSNEALEMREILIC